VQVRDKARKPPSAKFINRPGIYNCFSIRSTCRLFVGFEITEQDNDKLCQGNDAQEHPEFGEEGTAGGGGFRIGILGVYICHRNLFLF
jgi:hypothetical protein